MKKLFSVILVLVLALSTLTMTGCSTSNDTVKDLKGEYTQELAGTTLNVFNWGEYISDGSEGSLDVIAAFEKLTGINVNYSMFDSNETMYAKLKSGAVSYDIIIPSDYMIERLVNEDRLAEIDYSKLSNYSNIDKAYTGMYFDPEEKYTVPFSIGMVGLIYNTTVVTEKPDSWGVMWDKKYKDQILTFNNSRDAFAIAQLYLGIDLNTKDKSEWDAVANKLKEQNEILQGRVMDEVFNKMESGSAAIAPYYAGDYLTMAEENEDLAFVYPKEGVNEFVDSICVPKDCGNYDAAMMFINFLLEPEVAKANAEYICYATPNMAVRDNPDYLFYQNEILYPAEKDRPRTEYFHDMDKDTRAYFEGLWEEVLQS